MDRIDIHLDVPAVQYRDLSGGPEGASSAEMCGRVAEARKIQKRRFEGTRIHGNAGMRTRQIRQFCAIDSEAGELMERAMERFGLSARAHARILKIARTIADLEAAPNIRASHLAEAIQYRTLDRKMVR
jgi:magnesium chelatase family protein